jgi:TonB family protein
MLHPFVSARSHAGRRTPLLLSVAAHLLVIALLLAPTATSSWSAGEVERSAPLAVEPIRYVDLSAAAPVVTAPLRRRIPRALPELRRPAAPNIDAIAIAGPPAMPAIEATLKVDDAAGAPSGVSVRFADLVRGPVRDTVAIASRSGPYTKDDVDRTVSAFANNPKPEYPWLLRSRGVEGSFDVRFVVDSTGRVDETSIEFPESADKLFVNSVRRALVRSRYNPAEIAGRAVTQLVEQRFTFVLVP